jgi:nucleoprotein TPR
MLKTMLTFEIVQSFEERYSRELLAHAESINVIENLKRQLGTAQALARDNLVTAETAQAKLSTSEASWMQQKDALDKEVADLNARFAPMWYFLYSR